MYRIIVFIISLLFVGSICLKAQQHHYSFHQISIKEGLSQSSAQAILLDTKGTLWIGTKNGLNGYVQQELKTYFHEPDNPNSIPHNTIHHIEEDKFGTIWVSTANGIATYNYQGNEFTLISRNIAFSSLKTDDGILFGGDNFILRYDYQLKNIERIFLQPEDSVKNPAAYRIQSLISWDKNKILVGTRQKGIYIYDIKGRTFTPFINIPRPLLMSLYLSSDGHIYTSHYGEGLFCYDRNGNELYNYKVGNSSLTNNYILDITEHDGNIWLATDGGGINLLSLTDGNISSLQQTAGDPLSLPDNSIVKLYNDNNGNLWAGSIREGIFIVKRSHIQTFKDVTLNTPYGLSDKTVISLHEEENGEVWIGTDGGGVNHYSPSTNRFTHFPNTNGDKITSITSYSNEELLISIYTRGLHLFNKKTGSYRPFIIVNKKIDNQERYYGYLPLAHRVNNEKIYILGLYAWCYHLSDQQFTPIKFTDPSTSPSGLKLAFVNDSISLLTRENCIYMGNLSTDSVSFCFKIGKEERINAVSMDKKHRIWIGTNHSFGYYDLKEKEYHRIPTQLFNSVSFLTTDSKNRLWICAQNMLYTYDATNNKFNVWNSADGYTPNEILFSFQRMSHSDYIYLGGTEGLVKIQTKGITPKNTYSKIELADLHFNGLSCKKMIKDHTIEIPWNYLSLSAIIQISSQDIFQKKLIRFITRTNDTERQYESYDNTFNLTTLAPGKYSIWASCNQKDGTFIEPVHLIDIIITPPWYKTTWFFLLLAMLLATLFIYGIRYATKRKQKMMENKMEEYKQQVEEDKLKFLINISQRDKEFMSKFNELIHNNLSTEDITIDFLTDNLAVSRASLYNKVKVLTGLGVNDYINRIRIERAEELLTQTNKSINEISSEVGFTYPRYFSTLFKKVKGVTPTQFKEQIKNRNTDQPEQA